MSKKDYTKSLNSCQICAKKAVGYHYGAYVCEACKKFFVRHTSGVCQLYGSCQENGSCDLTINGRGKCQHCRYRRCVEIGMDISYKSSDYNLTAIPCQVCSAKSSGLHFGCITCEGCKGFFRRMIKFSGMLVCFNNNKCEMNSNTRSACKSCRLERCILIGMSRKGIRIGRHPNALKYSCIKLLKTDKMNRDDDLADINTIKSFESIKSQISSIRNGDLTSSDSETISDRDIIQEPNERKISQIAVSEKDPNTDDEMMSIKDELIAFPSDVCNDEMPLVISTDIYNNGEHTMMEKEIFKDIEEHIMQIIDNMSPSSVFLTQKDSNISHLEKASLMGSDSSQNVWSAMMDHFVFHSQFIVKFAKLIPGFSKLCLQDKKVVIKDSMYPMMLLELSQEYYELDGEIVFNYFDFSCSDRDIILDFFPEFIDFSNHLKKSGSIKNLLKLNGVEMTLLCGIIMFYNYLNLSNGVFGRSMMNMYQEFLIVYYTTKLLLSSQEATARLRMCLQFINILNEMNYSHHQIITNFCASHSELQYPDLYIEIFNN